MRVAGAVAVALSACCPVDQCFKGFTVTLAQREVAVLREGPAQLTACVGTTCTSGSVDFSSATNDTRDFSLADDALSARVDVASELVAPVSLRIERDGTERFARTWEALPSINHRACECSLRQIDAR